MQSAPMRRLLALFFALLCAAGAPGASADPFPRPAAIQPMVDFWTRIYTEVSTDSGLIHDSRHLGVVYERVVVPPTLRRRTRERRIAKVKKRYAAVLRTLAQGKRDGLSAEESRVLALWPDGVSNGTLAAAAHRLRFQRGQADKFRDGLVRSGRWREYIRTTFAQQGLPPELGALPHVESSFNARAYSKVGAAGLWQFTRSTGRRYMRVDSAVDERMDPFKATVAAAKLMAANYEITDAWPLAITAYNHGAAGMRRAKRRLGTDEIDVIIAKYKSRTFGFASRNFYTEFLAALEIDKNPERYFGPIAYDRAETLETLALDRYYPGRSIARALGIEVGLLQQLNPSLRAAVWSGQKRVPKGFSLRVPPHLAGGSARRLLASIPKGETFDRQTRDRYHRVRRGETLSVIARRYGVSERTLLSLNSLRSRHRIRAGQRLRLPDDPADRRVARAGRAVPVEPAWEGDEYRVRRGETLDSIARRVGSTPRALAAANGIRNANRIYVGQTLQVPGAKQSSKSAPAPAPTQQVAQKATPDPPQIAPTPVPAAPPTADPAATRAAETPPSAMPGAPAGKRTPETTAATAPERSDPPAPAVEPVAIAELPTRDAPTPDTPPEDTAPNPSPADARVADATPGAPNPEVPATARSGAEAPAIEILAGVAPTTARHATREVETLLHADPERWEISGERATVQTDETLGHYADWLELPTQRLRSLNGMRGRSELVIGRRIRLDFARVTADEFRARRLAHHRALRVAFLESHSIRGTREHVLKRGETLWDISRSRYRIPLWLLRDYNPDVDFARLQTGVRLQIPDVERRVQGSSTRSAPPESPA